MNLALMNPHFPLAKYKLRKGRPLAAAGPEALGHFVKLVISVGNKS